MWILTYQPKIRIPSLGYKTYEPFWAQQQVLLDTGRFRHINKARQIGYTTTFAIEALHDFIYTPAAEIIVLSKSEGEAKRFLEKFYDAYDSISDKDPHCPNLKARNTLNAISEHGATINVLTSSKNAGRSFSATRLYFDEMAHTQFADDIYQASIPTISTTGGKVTLFSSPKGRGGLFAEIGRNTEDQGFSSHTFPWWFAPMNNCVYEEYMESYYAGDFKEQARLIEKAKTGEWYETNMKKYSTLAFQQEFECNYDADEDSVFNARQLKNCFRKNYLEEVPGAMYEHWYIEPDKDHNHVTGIDLGRKRDATVIKTYDVDSTPIRLVEYKRIPPATSDWGLIELAIRDTYAKFESDMIHDATGVGDAIGERIEDISEPHVLTATNKYNILENTRRAMDLGVFIEAKIGRSYREFEEYIWNDKHIVQDCVIATALAVKVFYQPESTWTGAINLDYVESINED